eukprot:TRINITY_DN3002_c0_g1_i3.p1 TRINITY_DN3002_c0_g1~~TRINITY_DN3002_c0_g1_i3.p1  ORF type:complete len:688 (+),score=107.66 TRINITY_DN3002_c0_g1_i3:27-2066(+)
MKKIKKFGRKLVSGDKYRYTEHGYNLDLTYITDRIIAMGIPGENIVSMWRNDINHVASFLDEFHFDNYRIYNLSGEKYDYEKFGDRVVEYGFPDHHPPTLDTMHRVVLDIDEWLKKRPETVAVVHCLAGRSRTGTIVCGYLLYAGMFQTAHESIDYFNVKRSVEGENVVLPSQVRCVKHYEEFLRNPVIENITTKSRKLLLEKIEITPVIAVGLNHDFFPIIKYYQLTDDGGQKIPSRQEHYREYWSSDEKVLIEGINTELKGDTLIKFFHKSSKKQYPISLNKIHDKVTRMKLLHKKFHLLLFRVSFHTNYIPLKWELNVTELDAPYAGPVVINKNISQNLRVKLSFRDVTNEVSDYQKHEPEVNQSVPQKNPRRNSTYSTYQLPVEIHSPVERPMVQRREFEPRSSYDDINLLRNSRGSRRRLATKENQQYRPSPQYNVESPSLSYQGSVHNKPAYPINHDHVITPSYEYQSNPSINVDVYYPSHNEYWSASSGQPHHRSSYSGPGQWNNSSIDRWQNSNHWEDIHSNQARHHTNPPSSSNQWHHESSPSNQSSYGSHSSNGWNNSSNQWNSSHSEPYYQGNHQWNESTYDSNHTNDGWRNSVQPLRDNWESSPLTTNPPSGTQNHGANNMLNPYTLNTSVAPLLNNENTHHENHPPERPQFSNFLSTDGVAPIHFP